MSKLVSRRAVELMRMDGDERLVACGELSEELLASPARLHKALSRTAADALAYVHSVAVALRDESAESAESVLQLQTSDERLVGIFTRGSGVVFCERGRTLFDRALAETTERLNSAVA